MSLSKEDNFKKTPGENTSLLDLRSKKSYRDVSKGKSPFIVKMPPITTPSLHIGLGTPHKKAQFKLVTKHPNPLHAHEPRKPKPKNMSLSKDGASIFKGVKSNRSIQVNQIKFPDLMIDTTASNSVDFYDLEDPEEKEVKSSPMSPVKKTLLSITSSPTKKKENDAPPGGFSQALLDKLEAQVWPGELAIAKKYKTSTVPSPKNEKTKMFRPVLGRHNLSEYPEYPEDNSREQIENLHVSVGGDTFPNIGATKHSLKGSEVVKAYGANTFKGLIRNYNEDRVSIIMNISKPSDSSYQGVWPSCSYFAVYDGHGGEACADFLRDNLHKMIVRNSSFPMNPIAALRRGFAEAEARFLQEAEKSEADVETSGSCAIVVLIVGIDYYLYIVDNFM